LVRATASSRLTGHVHCGLPKRDEETGNSVFSWLPGIIDTAMQTKIGIAARIFPAIEPFQMYKLRASFSFRSRVSKKIGTNLLANPDNFASVNQNVRNLDCPRI